MMTPSSTTIKKNSIKRNQRRGDKGKVTSLLSFTQMKNKAKRKKTAMRSQFVSLHICHIKKNAVKRAENECGKSYP